jgi:hypothetical protein
MERYRKKPLEIEAVHFNGTIERAVEIISWVGNNAQFDYNNKLLHIHTLEGLLRVDAGDYVIKGIKGEFYPCKPDIFEATYDPVP